MEWQQIVALIVMTIGSAALLGAVFLFLRHQPKRPRLSPNLKPAVGTVVDFENHGEPDDEVWHPVVEFTTADGKLVKGSTDWGDNPMPFLQGSRIPLRYDPDEPAELIHYAGPRRPRRTEAEESARLLLMLGAGAFILGLVAWLIGVYG